MKTYASLFLYRLAALAMLALTLIWLGMPDAKAWPGQPVSDYSVGQVVSGYKPRAGLNALKYSGPVQAINASTKQIKVQGVWLPVAQVWVPAAPPTVVPSYKVGDRWWWAQLVAPSPNGFATIGGHRVTGQNKVVLCLWIDSRVQPLTPAQCDAPPAGVVRVHVEHTDKL